MSVIIYMQQICMSTFCRLIFTPGPKMSDSGHTLGHTLSHTLFEIPILSANMVYFWTRMVAIDSSFSLVPIILCPPGS